jgi:hypothetical protein
MNIVPFSPYGLTLINIVVKEKQILLPLTTNGPYIIIFIEYSIKTVHSLFLYN